MTLSRKTTRITMLYSDEGRQNLWHDVNNTERVYQMLDWAIKEFGPRGTQQGRRWFHRIRHEIYWINMDLIANNNWRRVPRMRYWCDFYFRDPKDATWFELKRQ